SVTGRYSGIARLSFHPAESCLVAFVRSAIDDPPIYRTDRHYRSEGSDVGFGIGRHDEHGHIGLTAYMSSREEVGNAVSSYWSLETTLVLTTAEIRQLADELSVWFGYETVT